MWKAPEEERRIRICLCYGVNAPQEKGEYLLYFTLEFAQLLLQEIYGDFLHHNDGLHLDGVIADDAAWQRRLRRLAAQSAIWYATPSWEIGPRLTAILAAEWRGVISRIWNSERPLVFAHVVLTKTLGICRVREIRARITRWMDL